MYISHKPFELKQSVCKWHMASFCNRREHVCITRLQIGRTNLTYSYHLGQERPVCTCTKALTVKDIIKYCCALTELKGTD